MMLPLNVSSHSSIPQKWSSFHGSDRFVVNCVRSLIPKHSAVLLQFYDFFHPSSKPMASKPTKWNLDFAFLRESFKINVRLRE